MLTRILTQFLSNSTATAQNRVVLEGMAATLRADTAWSDGEDEGQPAVGLRTTDRAWASWGLSPAFYNQQRYLEQEYTSVEDSDEMLTEITHAPATRFVALDVHRQYLVVRQERSSFFAKMWHSLRKGLLHETMLTILQPRFLDENANIPPFSVFLSRGYGKERSVYDRDCQ